MTTLDVSKTPTKRRRGNVLFPENPFLASVVTRTRRVSNKRGDMQLVNSQTGEITANIAGFWEAEEVDSTRFLKLFINGVKALKELSPAGTKVFEVLYLKMQAGISKDQVYMSFSAVDQLLTPLSEATYTRGMRELVDKEFLAASPHIGLFWINPDFLWNGDRLAFVKEYRRRPTPAPVKDETPTLELPFGETSST